MSEKLPISFEQADNDQLEHHEQVNNLPVPETVTAPNEKEKTELLESLKAKADTEADKNEHGLDSLDKTAEVDKDRPTFINRELKQMSYSRTMNRVRQRLPIVVRPFSKFVHQPIVETVSESIGKTVARPSGILSGGIFAFIGSSVFLWISRHYGYEYNFLLLIILFAGGFLVGLLVELILQLIKKPKL
ncbi:MAG: hypothetical protein M3Q36_03660 [bacterium]|nr:hypothetical protein [bacterium]